jgi:hypothetical protein
MSRSNSRGEAVLGAVGGELGILPVDAPAGSAVRDIHPPSNLTRVALSQDPKRAENLAVGSAHVSSTAISISRPGSSSRERTSRSGSSRAVSPQGHSFARDGADLVAHHGPDKGLATHGRASGSGSALGCAMQLDAPKRPWTARARLVSAGGTREVQTAIGLDGSVWHGRNSASAATVNDLAVRLQQRLGAAIAMSAGSGVVSKKVRTRAGSALGRQT